MISTSVWESRGRAAKVARFVSVIDAALDASKILLPEARLDAVAGMGSPTTTTKAAPATRDLGDRYGSGTRTAKITVRAQCTCGGPWFRCWERNCPGAEELAIYECEGYAEAPATPLPDAVREVRAIYPKADLVYLP